MDTAKGDGDRLADDWWGTAIGASPPSKPLGEPTIGSTPTQVDWRIWQSYVQGWSTQLEGPMGPVRVERMTAAAPLE